MNSLRTRQHAAEIALLIIVNILIAGCSDSTQARLSENAKRGKEAFIAYCSQCHQLRGAGGSAGPSLAGIIGRPAGTGEFSYSEAMRNSGITWTPATLDLFLQAPRETIPDNQMAFFGMEDSRVRADLIEYIVAASGN